MEILSRREAILAGKSQYFTGKPCISGHIEFRYTASGTCSKCVNVSTTRNRTAKKTISRKSVFEERRRLREERKIAITHLAEVPLRAFVDDWPVLRETAYELCLAAYGVLTRYELLKATRRPIKAISGTALYRVLVPAWQGVLIREVAQALMAARQPDLSALHPRQCAEIVQDLPLPDWVLKP